MHFKPCCDKLREAMGNKIDKDWRKDSVDFWIIGCCGSCWTFSITHCPFCGTKLEVQK